MACTPISTQDLPGSRADDRLAVDSPLPRFALVGTEGEPLSPETLRGSAVVMALVASPELAGGNRVREVLYRLMAARDRLLPTLRARLATLVVITEPSDATLLAIRETLGREASPEESLHLARDPHAEVLALAARLGVAAWPDGGQHVVVAVVDRDGIVVDVRRGVWGWDEGDLLASMAVAARR